jgi:hypothetical protein
MGACKIGPRVSRHAVSSNLGPQAPFRSGRAYLLRESGTGGLSASARTSGLWRQRGRHTRKRCEPAHRTARPHGSRPVSAGGRHVRLSLLAPRIRSSAAQQRGDSVHRARPIIDGPNDCQSVSLLAGGARPGRYWDRSRGAERPRRFRCASCARVTPRAPREFRAWPRGLPDRDGCLDPRPDQRPCSARS